MRATRDLALVRIDMPAESKIALPDTIKDDQVIKATRGTVVSVGPECEEIKEGDYVHYNSFVGNQIKDEELDDGIYVVVAEKDILCIK